MDAKTVSSYLFGDAGSRAEKVKKDLEALRQAGVAPLTEQQKLEKARGATTTDDLKKITDESRETTDSVQKLAVRMRESSFVQAEQMKKLNQVLDNTVYKAVIDRNVGGLRRAVAEAVKEMAKVVGTELKGLNLDNAGDKLSSAADKLLTASGYLLNMKSDPSVYDKGASGSVLNPNSASVLNDRADVGSRLPDVKPK
jgi:hypothetical protein